MYKSTSSQSCWQISLERTLLGGRLPARLPVLPRRGILKGLSKQLVILLNLPPVGSLLNFQYFFLNSLINDPHFWLFILKVFLNLLKTHAFLGELRSCLAVRLLLFHYNNNCLGLIAVMVELLFDELIVLLAQGAQLFDQLQKNRSVLLQLLDGLFLAFLLPLKVFYLLHFEVQGFLTNNFVLMNIGSL